MLLVIMFPLALLGYFFSVRYLFRKWRCRWAVWLWGLTFWGQLPFFFNGRDWGSQLFIFVVDPFDAWVEAWRKTPVIALWLLLVPSVPAFLAYWVQHQRYTRPPAPPSPPRPWVVPTLFVGFFVSLLAMLWWLHNG